MRQALQWQTDRVSRLRNASLPLVVECDIAGITTGFACAGHSAGPPCYRTLSMARSDCPEDGPTLQCRARVVCGIMAMLMHERRGALNGGRLGGGQQDTGGVQGHSATARSAPPHRLARSPVSPQPTPHSSTLYACSPNTLDVWTSVIMTQV